MIELNRISFIQGFAVGLLFVAGCATTNLGYKYYSISSLPDECYSKGVMLGKLGSDGWSDIPFSECQPSDQIKGKCITMLSSEFYALKKEVLDLRQRLSDCQTQPPAHVSSLSEALGSK